jgi:proteic killer suppression protein
MDINFKSKKLEKLFNSSKELSRKYGQNAGVIDNRMALFRGVICLNDIPEAKPTRRHQLSENRNNQFAVDLKHPYRLIFCANHDELPLKDDGGIDLVRVTAITIIEVKDYH